MFNFLIDRFFGVFGFADHKNDINFWMLGSEAYLSIIPIKYSIIYVFSMVVFIYSLDLVIYKSKSCGETEHGFVYYLLVEY